MSEKRGTDSTAELHKAYHAASPEETAGIYDDWSADYDAHMKNVGYAHPAMVTGLLTRHLGAGDHAILDAGAGTGILGGILAALGYTDLTGLDASERMLARAAETGHYRDLRHLFLGRPLDFADGCFDAVVSSGVFTPGHAPLAGFDELVRVTRPGGLLVFTVARAYLEGPFDEKRRDLEERGLWRLVEASGRYNSTPLEDELIARVYAFKAC